LINTINKEKLANLKSLIANNKVEISLHGYTHGLDLSFKDGLLVKKYRTEFKGMNYDEQFYRISTAKRVVDSILNIDIKIFIPPYNSYDKNTLKVLKKLDFNIISSDNDGSSAVKEMSYIPENADEVKLLKDKLKSNKNKSAVVVFMFHPYIFKFCCPDFNYPMNRRVSFSEFDALLKWIKNQSYIETFTLSGLNKEENFGAKRLRANTDRFNLALSVAHRKGFIKNNSYQTYPEMKKSLAIYHLMNVFVHFFIFLFVFYVARFATKLLKKKVLFLYVPLVLGIGLTLIRYFFSPTWFMMLIILLLGLIAATLGTYKELKNQYNFISEPVIAKKTAPESYLK
jgi:hypothetical protein